MSQETRERTRLTARDLLRFHMADDPQLSPDGTQVAWVCTWMDAEQNGYRSQICVTSLEDGSTRTVSPGTGLETHPRWSPDGRFLAYLAPGSSDPASTEAPVGPSVSVVGRGAQLWVVAGDGGESRQLTALASGIAEPSWSPDGTKIVFTTYAHPESGLTLPDARRSEDPYEKFNRDVLVVDRLRWKSDGAGLVGNYRRHVAMIAFDESKAGSGEVALLTLGKFDLSSPTWSPDGQTLAVAGNLDEDGEEARKGYIYLLDLSSDAPIQPRQLFGLEEMRSSDLAWSPDGQTLAVCGHNDPQMGHYGNQRLWLVSVSDGSAECVTEHLDFTFGDYSRNADMRRYGGEDGPRWLPDGRSLLILVNEGGTVHLNEFSLEERTLTVLTKGDLCVTAFTMDDAAQRIALLVSEDLNPADLFLLDRAKTDASMERLTTVNEELLASLELAPSIRFQFESDGHTVDGWLVPPVEREPGKRYPLILYPGGGPGSMRASVFCHEFHLYAANGYAVVHCNARGNHGYGEDFSKAIRGRWGDADYRDNMACVRAALEQFDFLDPDRLAVAGGSYGGYSTTWIVEHETMFSAAVVDRCLFNRYSFNGTSDMGFLLDRVEFDRQYPWEVPDRYIEWSPLTYVENIQTPTLVVHSELDHRCPVEQGEQLYMALKRRGVPTELVRFPNETHELSRGGRPWHRVYRLDRYLDWFERWL